MLGAVFWFYLLAIIGAIIMLIIGLFSKNENSESWFGIPLMLILVFAELYGEFGQDQLAIDSIAKGATIITILHALCVLAYQIIEVFGRKKMADFSSIVEGIIELIVGILLGLHQWNILKKN